MTNWPTAPSPGYSSDNGASKKSLSKLLERVQGYVPSPSMGEGPVFTICSLLLPYGYQVTRANRIPPTRYIVIGVQRALALVGAQWLARFVRDEEAGGSSPLTPTIFLTIIVTPLAVLPIISPLPRLLPY